MSKQNQKLFKTPNKVKYHDEMDEKYREIQSSNPTTISASKVNNPIINNSVQLLETNQLPIIENNYIQHTGLKRAHEAIRSIITHNSTLLTMDVIQIEDFINQQLNGNNNSNSNSNSNNNNSNNNSNSNSFEITTSNPVSNKAIEQLFVDQNLSDEIKNRLKADVQNLTKRGMIHMFTVYWGILNWINLITFNSTAWHKFVGFILDNIGLSYNSNQSKSRAKKTIIIVANILGGLHDNQNIVANFLSSSWLITVRMFQSIPNRYITVNEMSKLATTLQTQSKIQNIQLTQLQLYTLMHWENKQLSQEEEYKNESEDEYITIPMYPHLIDCLILTLNFTISTQSSYLRIPIPNSINNLFFAILISSDHLLLHKRLKRQNARDLKERKKLFISQQQRSRWITNHPCIVIESTEESIRIHMLKHLVMSQLTITTITTHNRPAPIAKLLLTAFEMDEVYESSTNSAMVKTVFETIMSDNISIDFYESIFSVVAHSLGRLVIVLKWNSNDDIVVPEPIIYRPEPYNLTESAIQAGVNCDPIIVLQNENNEFFPLMLLSDEQFDENYFPFDNNNNNNNQAESNSDSVELDPFAGSNLNNGAEIDNVVHGLSNNNMTLASNLETITAVNNSEESECSNHEGSFDDSNMECSESNNNEMARKYPKVVFTEYPISPTIVQQSPQPTTTLESISQGQSQFNPRSNMIDLTNEDNDNDNIHPTAESDPIEEFEDDELAQPMSNAPGPLIQSYIAAPTVINTIPNRLPSPIHESDYW